MNLIRSLVAAASLCVCTSISAQENIRVYAASSMTNAVNELVEQFKQEHAITVTTVYAGSSSLARQIEQGAPIDLYISANEKWMDYLVQSGVVMRDAVINIATNKLVVVGTESATLDIKDPQSWLSLLAGNRLAIGQTNAVPAGIYAQQSLESLGVWSELKSSLAPTKNVRIALTLVERQETPLGIVYKTDANLSDKVTLISELPDDSHTPITYPMARLNDKASTASFAQFVLSEQGQSILQSYGFSQNKTQ